MDFSEARVSRIESQSSTDSFHDQRRQGYFSMSKIKNGFRSLSSRCFLLARGKATPQPMEDTESVSEFLINLKWSDLFDLPGEYVRMNGEMLSTLSDGNEEWLEKLRRHRTPLACLKNDQGDSVLHLAATWGHLELVKSIVSEWPCLLLEPNSKDQLPSHVAACAGHRAVVKALVASLTFFSARLVEEDREILDPYLLKDINGDTALNLALQGCYMKVALCLVNANQQASFLANIDGISPLYLAIEAGHVSLVKAMLGNDGLEGRNFNLEGRQYLAHAAMKSMSTDILDVILNEYPSILDERDEENRTCLMFGASMGYYEGVCKLLDRSTEGLFVCDDNGSYPIHMAVEKGHIKVVKKILKRCPYSKHLLSKHGQNILHIAAESGKFKILRHLTRCERTYHHLALQKDVDGNTPLHLATLKWRPRAAYYLARGKNLLIENNSGLTALDIVELNLQPHYILMERLTLVALVYRHVIRDRRLMKTMKLTRPSVPLDRGGNKEYVNALIVVAALVATVTFAAGFTLPGGYKSSAPNLGSATLVKDSNFTYFLILNIVAMQSSVVAVVSLLWAQLGDPALCRISLNVALPSLCIAIISMSYAFVCAMVIAVGDVAGLRLGLALLSVFFMVMLIFIVVPHNFLQRPSVHFRYYLFFLPFVLFINDDEGERYQSSTQKLVKGAESVELEHIKMTDTS